MDDIGIVSIGIGLISCLVAVFSFLNTKEKERVDRIDAWSKNFENKMNNLLKFCGSNSAFAFKYDFSSSLFLDFGEKSDAEEYNKNLKDKAHEKDSLKSAYQECKAIVTILFNKNDDQILIEDLINNLYKKMDEHFSNILTLNDIREKFYCNQIADKEIAKFLDKVFGNLRELIVLHSIVEKMKNYTMNAIQINLINNRSVLGFSSKKLISWMARFVKSFDEYKYYQTIKLDGLGEEFCKWLGSVDREMQECRAEVLLNLNIGKSNFKQGAL